MADDATIEAVDESTSEAGEEAKKRIELSVDVSDTGPCQKHVKVTIPREEVDRFFDKEFSDLVKNANVPGFRPGKTPRKLIEKRFRKDVSSQVKVSLVMQSLEQIGEEQKIEPLSEPDIDFKAIELPDDADFTYEFDVEVRPEFDLPEYKGLEITRPSKEFADKDVDEALDRLRRSLADTVVKDGPVAVGDTVIADVRFVDGKEVLREFEELSIRVDDDLYFRDGKIDKFAEGISGVVAGDTRELKVTLSDSLQDANLRGKVVDGIFVIREVKQNVLPDIDDDFFARVGCSDEGEVRDMLLSSLQSRLKYQQKQAATAQVMKTIVQSATWELPPDLLRRQTVRTLERKIIELQQAGYGDEEIRARINVLRQNSQATTAESLKQQFVLQRIAEAEEIKIEEADLEAEIDELAARTGDSKRRVRARIEKESLWESVALHALERKAVEKILEYATIKDVPFEEEELRSTGLDEAAIPEDEVKPVAPAPEVDS